MNHISFLKKTYRTGVANFQQGHFDRALKQLRYCIKQEYEVCNSYFYIGLFHYYQWQLSDAYGYFQKILLREESYAGAYYFLGCIQKELQNTEEAILLYKRAIRYSSDILYPMRACIELKSMVEPDEFEGYKREAYKPFVIRFVSSKIEQSLGDVFSYWISDDYNLAETTLKQVIHEYPKHFQLLVIIVDLLLVQGKYHNALEALLTLHKQFGLVYFGLQQIIYIYFLESEYKKALFYMKGYFGMVPHITYRDYYRMGILYHQCGNTERAAHYFEKSIQMKSSFFPSVFNLAICFHQLGRFESAISYYHKSMSIDGNNATVYYNLGLVYFEMRDDLQALFYLDKASQIEPSFQEARDNFYHISYLHMFNDKGFYKQNQNFVVFTIVILLFILGVLTTLHMVRLL